MLIAIAATLVVGCGGGGHDLVSVTGIVRLDGEPLPKARVSFQPRPAGEDGLPGPGSIGETDEQGRYTLALPDGTSGVIVGTHDVRISTGVNAEVDGEIRVVRPEVVPERYNVETTLVESIDHETGDVNFDLESDPGG